MDERIRFLPAGDSALVVELGNAISPEINRRVRALDRALRAVSIPGIVEVLPTYRSLLVYYDPLRTSLEELQERIGRLDVPEEEKEERGKRVVEVPVMYGGSYGPDLAHVAEYHRLRPDEVIALHSGTDYVVAMMGFTPGFPYLMGLPEQLATPRLQTPRRSVPAGSVGIAENQTGIYPIESPGGWNIIGRTPLRLFDVQREPPFLIGPGDWVRFVPISEEEYRRLEEEVRRGSYRATVHIYE